MRQFLTHFYLVHIFIIKVYAFRVVLSLHVDIIDVNNVIHI